MGTTVKCANAVGKLPKSAHLSQRTNQLLWSRNIQFKLKMWKIVAILCVVFVNTQIDARNLAKREYNGCSLAYERLGCLGADLIVGLISAGSGDEDFNRTLKKFETGACTLATATLCERDICPENYDSAICKGVRRAGKK